ncbi:uncharacterized protein UMAG_03168 [Mycosarcoma maydis]|uniref:Uncharacterized protein n=1 Tax=Mycosarcoma maydis TaxID=5270 RepID=A0A0D1DYA6_MYCMD|nr:uncharacterized protein UMAG_03168 [Ustilago maydis 521]KIS68596.1 hypothetical protein UMAG_03168 [Ustilago maydis 521]|eukprot:XP_011389624.1 hypothetical protein UMAG_03168 [Ustilago maydis 521]
MSASSTPSSLLSRYEQYVAEDVAYHKASTPVSEMPSCTNMFDKWAACFALGPQLKAVYRYGGLQDCKAKLDDFKHCLTMKALAFAAGPPNPAKDRAVLEPCDADVLARSILGRAVCYGTTLADDRLSDAALPLPHLIAHSAV